MASTNPFEPPPPPPQSKPVDNGNSQSNASNPLVLQPMTGAAQLKKNIPNLPANPNGKPGSGTPPLKPPAPKKKKYTWRTKLFLILVLVVIIFAVVYTSNPSTFGDTDPSNPNLPPQETVSTLKTGGIIVVVIFGFFVFIDTSVAYVQRSKLSALKNVEGSFWFLVLGFGKSDNYEDSGDVMEKLEKDRDAYKYRMARLGKR